MSSNQITIDGEALQQVEAFIYLGSIIDKQGRFDANVKEQIRKARASVIQQNNIRNSIKPLADSKIRIFKTNVKTFLLYKTKTGETTI